MRSHQEYGYKYRGRTVVMTENRIVIAHWYFRQRFVREDQWLVYDDLECRALN